MTLAARANPSAPIGARDPLRAFPVVACDVAQSHALACASEGNNVRGLGACIVPRVAECMRADLPAGHSERLRVPMGRDLPLPHRCAPLFFSRRQRDRRGASGFSQWGPARYYRLRCIVAFVKSDRPVEGSLACGPSFNVQPRRPSSVFYSVSTSENYPRSWPSSPNFPMPQFILPCVLIGRILDVFSVYSRPSLFTTRVMSGDAR